MLPCCQSSYSASGAVYFWDCAPDQILILLVVELNGSLSWYVGDGDEDDDAIYGSFVGNDVGGSEVDDEMCVGDPVGDELLHCSFASKPVFLLQSSILEHFAEIILDHKCLKLSF